MKPIRLGSTSPVQLLTRAVMLAAACGLLLLVPPRSHAEEPPGGGDLPDLPKTGVVVPWEDFKKILEEIRNAQGGVTPPMPYAISPVTLVASVDGAEKRVAVHADFSVRVLDPSEWVEIPVMPEGAALTRLDLDGKPAPAYRSNGSLVVALRGEGNHTVSLEYAVPVNDSQGVKSAYLRFPQAPVLAIDLTIPRSGVDVNLGPAVVVERTESAGAVRVRAAYPYAGDAPVSWFEAAVKDEKDTKVFGEVHTLLTLGEGLLRGRVTATFTIHGKGRTALGLTLPKGLDVLNVDTSGMQDWKVTPAGDVQDLTVNLNHEAQGAITLTVEFEKQLGEASADLSAPDIVLKGVLRERGFLGVSAATNVEVTVGEKVESAVPVDPAELPTGATTPEGQPVLYAFKYMKHPVSVPLKMVRHADLAVKRTVAENLALVTFISHEGRILTSARYTVKNNRRQYLRLTLPEDAEVWAAYLDGNPVKAGLDSDKRVLLPLRQDAADQACTAEVVYALEGRKFSLLGGRRNFRGPDADVDVLNAEWHFFLPRDNRYFSFKGNLEEDEARNTIIAVGKTAYNLDEEGDRSQLQVVDTRRGKVLRDAKGEVPVDDLLERGDKDALGEDLAALGYTSGGAVPGKKKMASPPAQRKEEGEEIVEYLGEFRTTTANEMQSQFGMSNAAGYVAAGGRGRAAGILPVRFELPTEGLRVSFKGNLLKEGDPPKLRMRYDRLRDFRVRMPLWAAFLVGGLCAFLLGRLVREPWKDLAAAQRAARVAAVTLFVLIFVALAGARMAFAVGAVLAVLAEVLIRMRANAHVATSEQEGF